MKKRQYIYPAIFIKDEDESCQVLFPDLNIYTDGKNMTEAYVYAKGLLKSYLSYAIKYEIDFNKPTNIEKIMEKCKPSEIAMYIDAIVDIEE